MERPKSYKLDEASLGRVYQHVNSDKNVKSWGMVTAFRSLNTPKENRKLNKELEAQIRGKKLGFFKVVGYWRECLDADVAYADKTVKNPQTGRNIKVTSALKYDDKSPVYKAATSLVAMMNKK